LFTAKDFFGLDTRYLETLVAVANRGSLAGAARQLGLTATAVAQRLYALEAEFGTPLFTRAGRQVRPSEAGFAVLARADRFLAELDALRAAVSGREIVGELRIGAIATALTGLLPGVLDLLSKKHPGLRIFLEPGTSSDLYDRTLGGGLDASVLVRPPFDWPKGVTFRTWQREPLVLIAPGSETRDDYREIIRDWPLIIYDRRQWGGRHVAAWLDAEGLTAEPRFELDALDAIAVLVDRGLGVSVLPDWSGPRPEGMSLRRIPLPSASPREIGMIAPLNGPRTHLLRVLLETAGLPPG
jgi:DNA-binding transcriptional LysR family regulator